MGYHDASPRFSWKLDDDRFGAAQSAYQLVVARAPDAEPIWDSGKVESSQSVYVEAPELAFASRDQVFWRVRYWDQAGEGSDWSPWAKIEYGLLSKEEWTASWIHQPKREEISDIQITNAVYGINKRSKDITEALLAELDGNNNRLLSMTVGQGPLFTFENHNGNPTPLVIQYMENGKERRATSWDNQLVRFPPKEVCNVPYFRKEFELDEAASKARLYVTARGLFEIEINGQKVGQDAFTPGWTDYFHRIETLAYDVSKYLRPGQNVIGARLGRGWYAGQISRGTGGQIPELLAQLEVELTSGKSISVVTDETWTYSAKGPIVKSEIYWGEDYDASREITHWSTPGTPAAPYFPVGTTPLDDTILSPKIFQTVSVQKTLEPISIHALESGKAIFDMGQNMVGRPAVKIPVKKGQKVTLRVAEMLNQDGSLYTENYRASRSQATYLPARDGIVEWAPTFTFFGYRYLELTGYDTSAEPQSDWIRGEVLHTGFEKIGNFTSSHAKLNQLQSNIQWGQRGNFLDIPTDCPQRNERLGWTGDAQIFAATSLFNFDTHAFWNSWLRTLREQQSEDGRLPRIVPNVAIFPDSTYLDPAWGDAVSIVPWEVYLHTGDIRILADNYEAMTQFAELHRNKSIDFIGPNVGFGDWLQPIKSNNGKGRGGETPRPLIATAFHAYTSQICARTAELLGKEEDAAFYRQTVESIKQAIRAAFLDEDGRLTTPVETQTGYVVLLAFDLVDEALRPKLAAHLSALVERENNRLNTGFVGTPYLNRVLDETGYREQALAVLFTSEYPSWFYSIDQGATTLWERWNSYSHESGFGDASMNSFNHYAYGAVGRWMYERLAGLAPDEAQPGYKHIHIRPLLEKTPLTFAEASKETRYGLAKTSWRKEDGTQTIEVAIPPNATGTLHLPQAIAQRLKWTNAPAGAKLTWENGSCQLPAGQYEFTAEPAPLRAEE